MGIKSLGAEGWLVDVRPQGRDGKRVRKKFTTKSQAQQFERWVIATQNNKEWVDKPSDKRPLSELIDLWWKHHGHTLRGGRDSLLKLFAMDKYMNFPRAYEITPLFFADYRAKRLADGRKPKTLNNEQKILSGVFTTLIETGNYHSKNPLSKFRMSVVQKGEMGFLSEEEIKKLLSLLGGSDLLATKLCLATGARFGEVSKLRKEDVIMNRVTYINTKNGHDRTVPISKSLFNEITKNGNRMLFPNLKYATIRMTIKRVAPDLPKGQAVHVLRHTFASHFMMNGGNILTLRNILGHGSIQQTMVYAHFSPDYLLDAVKYNPLAKITGR